MAARRLALSCAEVAELLGVSVDSVRRATRKPDTDDGYVPSIRVAGRIVIPRRWVEEQVGPISNDQLEA